jgi:cellulose 1,4-beta-cellobiosidase
VVSQWGRGFEGEVAVVNNGPLPIADWQIVVALPGDQFTAVSGNASGYASNHILLLHPASYANQVPAKGTLRVFFTAYGADLTPQLCAFNDTACR